MANSIFKFLLALLVIPSCINPGNKVRPEGKLETPSTMTASTFYNLKATTLDGQSFDFEILKGKKVILLNTASKCGYTKQYADWEAFNKTHNTDWVVLGFPSNQFMRQEPGTSAEIADFCQKNYGVSFKMFEKVEVKSGADQSAVYKWLSDPAQNGWNNQVPSWNFCKYIVSEEGKLLAFFPSDVTPDHPDFKKLAGI